MLEGIKKAQLERQRQRDRKAFFELVQDHEKWWAIGSYTGKPSLETIMGSKVVAFWYPSDARDKRYIITVHGELEEINSYLKQLMVFSQREKALPHSRLWRVFAKQREIRIKTVRVEWETLPADDDKK